MRRSTLRLASVLRLRWDGSSSCNRSSSLFLGAFGGTCRGSIHVTVEAFPLRTCRRSFHEPTRLRLCSSRTTTVESDGASKSECKQDKEKQPLLEQPEEKPKLKASRDSIIPEANTKNIPVYRVVKHVMCHLWPKGETKYRFLVVASVMCVIASKVLKIAVPFFFKMIVDNFTPNCTTAPGADVSSIVTVLSSLQLGVFGLVAAYGISNLTSSLTEELKSALFAPVGSHASTAISMQLFRKLHSLDLHYHLGRETGVLSKDLDRGSRAFWSLAYALLFMVIPTVFEAVLVCVAMQSCAGFAFVATGLSALISYIGWTYVMSNWRAKYRARFNKSDSRVGGLIVDSFLNYETVKFFGREDYEEERIRRETVSMNHELKRLDQSMSLLNFGQHAIFMVAALMMLYLSTCGVLNGTMTVGDMVLVDALLMQLYTPLSFLGIIYREVQTSTQNMQAMIALLDIKSTITEKPDARPLQVISGTIEFRNVSFGFGGSVGERQILKNISLTIPGGSVVAFVGPSGSGKSTIFRLLYRFFDPTSGVILFDGQPLTDLQLKSFRKVVGVVPQDVVLFNETVRYNIRYGRLDATDEEVEEAARLANIHDGIMKMSEQYNTSVGERGMKLSGGEKQRVAIARALLDDPVILLADEATSALDSATERQVMHRLRETKTKKRTIILIAHRLTTVKDADIIFVLDGKGGVAGCGSHEELLEKCSLYSELWSQQLRDARHMGEGKQTQGNA